MCIVVVSSKILQFYFHRYDRERSTKNLIFAASVVANKHNNSGLNGNSGTAHSTNSHGKSYGAYHGGLLVRWKW